MHHLPWQMCEVFRVAQMHGCPTFGIRGACNVQLKGRFVAACMDPVEYE